MTLRAERIGWLRSLVADHRRLRAEHAELVRAERPHYREPEDDPDAADEMLAECERLADELEAELPPAPVPAAIDWTDVPL